MRWAEVQLGHCLQNRKTLKLGEFVTGDLTDESMGLHNLEDTLIVQGLTVTIGDHIPSIEGPDNGNHRFSEGLTLFPVGKIIV